MNRIKSAVIRRWVIAGERPFVWWSALLMIGSVGVIAWWPTPRLDSGPSDAPIRLWALVLQLIGAWTAARDLIGTASMFGHEGIIKGTLAWIIALIRGGRHVVIHPGSGNAEARFFPARFTVRRPMDPSKPVDERIFAVEINLSNMDKELGEVGSRVEAIAREAQDLVKAEGGAREAAIQLLRDQLKDAAIGNFSTLAFGVAWLAIGTIMSALAPEIALLADGQRRPAIGHFWPL